MINYTLRQLQYFVAVSEAGSLSAAATACHISQAAMSQSMAELERVVGTQLLVRNRARGVVLTAVGTEFLHDALALVRHAEEIQSQIMERQSELSGPLVIGCYSSLAAFWIPVICEQFTAPNPGLQVKIIEGDAAELQQRMLQGHVDVVLTHTRHLIADVEHRIVMSGRPYVLVSASHRFANRASVRLTELANDDFVSLDLPTVRDNQLVNLRMSGLDPKIRWSSQSFEAVRGMVARGLGYSVLVQRPPVNLSYDGLPLAVLEIDGPVGFSDVCVAYTATKRPSLRLRAFLDFCQKIGAERENWAVQE
ncbi:LysR substrate-binding domain-containing protein [Glutamicibacter sp.]|uniref:LysR substrate-binding domain-containing protein n=1 Tax=Glutamicibacter sp. TaxID=1931995 RepID=UPI0028BF1C88|nr:LysR substrate-binding domain-containing protein [Glutamicibacter sp.]